MTPWRLCPCLAADAFREGSLFDALYADDSIPLGSNAAHVEEYAAAVEAAGAKYGADFIGYLGGLISHDGRAVSEIFRKLGQAYGDYKQLRSVWSVKTG